VSTAVLSPGRPSPLGTAFGRLRASPFGNLLRAIRSNRKATVGTAVLAILVLLALFPYLVAPDNPSAEIYSRSAGPSLGHLLGTTAYGQDLFAQLIWSTRASLVIAVGVGLLTTVISALVGVTAAYVGGITDDVLSLFTDIFLVIPTFPLVVVIAAYLKGGGNDMLVFVLVVTGWSYGARQLRSQTLSLRNRDFLVAARLRGERSWRIVVSEILPTMTSLIVANFLGSALYAVLTAAGLQFLGLGNTDIISWGTMLYWAQNNEALQAGQALWAIMPGIGIAVLGGALALLNYAFDEIGNPALRPVRRRRVRRRNP